MVGAGSVVSCFAIVCFRWVLVYCYGSCWFIVTRMCVVYFVIIHRVIEFWFVRNCLLSWTVINVVIFLFWFVVSLLVHFFCAIVVYVCRFQWSVAHHYSLVSR